jgi:hypothetical protein
MSVPRVSPRPASSENTLEKEILRFYPDPLNQELWDWGPAMVFRL